MVRARAMREATTHVKRARFAFTSTPSESEPQGAIGNRALFSGKIPGFASPPHDGFALDDVHAGG